MSNFSRRELIGSLLCPFLTLFWGAIRFVNDILILGMGFTGRDAFHIMYIVAFFIGGILPAILTLALGVHTERYLKKRLIVIVVVYLLDSGIGLIGYPVVMFSLSALVDVGAVLYQILKVQDEDTSGSQRAVLMLSDPVLYWLIYWFIFWFTYFLGK